MHITEPKPSPEVTEETRLPSGRGQDSGGMPIVVSITLFMLILTFVGMLFIAFAPRNVRSGLTDRVPIEPTFQFGPRSPENQDRTSLDGSNAQSRSGDAYVR